MGSLGGHMSHLWEDLDLTFGDLNEIFYHACTGNLEATEKFDGINIHFRVDASGELRFARNGKDQERGGLTQAQFAKVMENHPASQTFVDGSEALFRLTQKSFWPFGFSGRNWINCDLINEHRAMCLDYDECAIVFHGVRNFNSSTLPSNLNESFSRYSNGCAEFSVVVNGNEWRVSPPVSVHLPDLRGEGILSNLEESINNLMVASGCDKNSTLKDFARVILENGPIADLRISAQKKSDLIAHIFRDGGTSLVKIKNGLPKYIAGQVSELGSAKNRNRVIGEAMLPLELVVTYGGARILENVASSMIEDSAGEKERLRNSVQAAIMLVETCSDEYHEERSHLLERYISKFEKCGGLTSSVEGVVFEWSNGCQYKLTGTFAPINHILGIPRYGRGKIPPVDTGHSLNEIAEDIQLIKAMTTF
jgi:hypothetical protein